MIKMIPVMAGIIFFVSCKNDMETVKQITNIETYPTMEIEEFKFFRSDSGQITVKVKSPLVREFSAIENPYREFPEGLVATFLDRDQTIKSKITANYVIQKIDEEKWIARHDVEVIDQDGRIINTEYMVFDQKKGKIYSDQFTKFTETDAIIYGKGFESDMNLTNARILEPTGFFYVDEEQY
ncbi:LPS export ABC transporter periplasmic protein LptC [Salinivirga cyanobacteriivorans]|nr:LPS export ABC transporter periplasmic protein LptC [Salinivirga cyanobacteriivorans]